MHVVLRVVGGKNDGREIKIGVPRFIVGRGDTAHLRPASDLVSREHTSIELKDGRVVITDLNSRNGTFVNGEKLESAHVARAGDTVRIGRLQFEMVIDPAKAGAKKPKVTNVVDAAIRTLSDNKQSLEDSISDWLLEGEDDDDLPDSSQRAAIASHETIQLNLDDTAQILRKNDEVDPGAEAPEDSGDTPEKKGKSKPRKLPPRDKVQHDSSTTAADDVLKKFFNRR